MLNGWSLFTPNTTNTTNPPIAVTAVMPCERVLNHSSRCVCSFDFSIGRS